jgi:transposase
MPSVNKKSLRQEFDQLKDRFTVLSNEGQVTPEVGTLFQAMIMLFELLIAVFMEKTTAKNNRNSSKPSSQTGKDQTATQSGTNGKGKQETCKTRGVFRKKCPAPCSMDRASRAMW